MSKIDPAWEQVLRAQPDAQVHAIVRTTGPPPGDPTEWDQRGLRLRHTFTLVPGVAVSGPAHAILKLLDEPWVAHVEPDREVRAF